jgi:lipid-binding SYLF domain-containing protein
VLGLINRSDKALKDLFKNKDLEMLPGYIKKSKAILIFPEIYEGSLLFGAKGGNGLLLIRKNGSWTGPFFYTIGGLSVGLQFGLKSGKVVMTIMSLRGLKSILGERVKFGVDIDAAVMNEGIGYSAESTLRLADIFSFSDNKGLFLGGSFEGTYLQPRNDLNFSLYNQEYTKEEILEETSFNKAALEVIQILKNINSETK